MREIVPAGTLLWRVHPRATAPTAPVGELLGASFRETTALAEGLVRGKEFNPRGIRWIRRAELAGMVLSGLRTEHELTVCRVEPDAPIERTAGCDGVLWQSTVDLPHPSLALFGTSGVVAVPGLTRRLDDADGAAWLNEVLGPYGVRVRVPAPDDLPTFFINYRNGDCVDVVKMLDRELVSRFGKGKVFEARRSLPHGKRFPDALLRNARGTKVMFSVIGVRWNRNGHAVSDDWVVREIAEALKHGVHVVPVIVGYRSRPTAAELPDAIKEIANLQTKQLRHECDDVDIARMLDELAEHLPELRSSPS